MTRMGVGRGLRSRLECCTSWQRQHPGRLAARPLPHRRLDLDLAPPTPSQARAQELQSLSQDDCLPLQPGKSPIQIVGNWESLSATPFPPFSPEPLLLVPCMQPRPMSVTTLPSPSTPTPLPCRGSLPSRGRTASLPCQHFRLDGTGLSHEGRGKGCGTTRAKCPLGPSFSPTEAGGLGSKGCGMMHLSWKGEKLCTKDWAGYDTWPCLEKSSQGP